MAVARPILGLVSLIILAAGVLFQFFIILSGIVNVRPFNQTYFLEAAAGERNPSRWTFWKICGVVGGLNGNCGAIVPALPFDPPRNFNYPADTPTGFNITKQYWYMSRFMFAFFLIALFFAALALFTGVLALCTRLGAFLSGLNTMLAAFFQAIAAALMTACFIKGRNTYRSAGTAASISTYGFAWMWAAFAAYFICTIFFCTGGAVGRKSDTPKSTGKKSMFGRKQSTRSRGSFIDSESQRRVKEDYE